MGAIIFIIFCNRCFSVVLGEQSQGEYKAECLLVLRAVVLVLVAGLREVGVDPDSVNYEYAFHHYDDDRISGAIEYSYFLISEILSRLTNDVHIIFVFYAFFGVMLQVQGVQEISARYVVPARRALFEFHLRASRSHADSYRHHVRTLPACHTAHG